MGHLLHLMFRCDGDVMESDVFVGVFGGSKRGPSERQLVSVSFERLIFL